MAGVLRAVPLLIIGIFAAPTLAQIPLALPLTISLEAESDPEARALFGRAQALIAQGEADAAYLLLAPRERDLAGNVLFDYLLGVAALDSERTGEAIFSLRRALVTVPGFSGARMELARAYYEAGDLNLARPLFEQLLQENPPPRVARVINQYVVAIDSRRIAGRPVLTPYVETMVGYDSNANGSTDDEMFLGFTLAEKNVEEDSMFAEIAAGVDWLRPITPAFAWQARGRASHRVNPDADFVDATVVSGIGGFTWYRGRSFGAANLDGYWSALDGDSNERYVGGLITAGLRMTDAWDLLGEVRGGALRFDSDIDVLDVNRVLGSLGVRRHFHNGPGWVAARALIGGDSERENGSPYGNDRIGARVETGWSWADDRRWYASFGWMETDYDEDFFGMDREDTRLTATLELEWRPAVVRNVSIVPRVRWTDNDSDVSLYEYGRYEIGVMVRWAPQ